jgi:hypothetical protein
MMPIQRSVDEPFNPDSRAALRRKSTEEEIGRNLPSPCRLLYVAGANHFFSLP